MIKSETVLNGMPPYFEAISYVFYITRGRMPWQDVAPVSLEEWRAVCIKHPALTLEDDFIQHNIDRGVDEIWREMGRCRWLESPAGIPEYLHFSGLQIEYLHGGPFLGGKIRSKYLALCKNLGKKGSFEDWINVVANDTWLQPDTDSGEPGRALWMSRKGRTKHVFRYTPPGVWMYFSSKPGDASDGYEALRQDFCEDLADRLRAFVWKGLGDAKGIP